MAEYQDGARAVDEETGTPIVFKGGEWIEDASPEVSMTGGGRGRLGWIENTPELTQRLNTVEPADVAATGIAGGLLTMPATGLGLAADVGLQAAAGAIPGFMEGGLQGAGIGGALGIGGGLIGKGIELAAAPVRKSIGAMMQEADDLVRGVIPAAREPTESPMLAQAREKAAQTIGRSAAPGGRALGDDFATADELAAIGFPLTKAELAHNAAKTGTNEINLAREAMEAEQRSMSGLLGRGVAQTKQAQKEAGTNWVASQLGLPQGQQLTDTVLSDVYQSMGTQFDDFAASLGAIDVEDVMPALEKVSKRALTESKGEVDAIVKDIKTLAEQNGGRITGADWQRIRTDIGEMQEVGARQKSFGKVSDAADLMETMTKAMEDQLPAAAKESVQDLRHRYALLSAVRKGAATSKEGEVNIRTLANNWKRPQSNKYKGKDEFGRMLNAFNAYTPSRVPDSGTAGRLLQAAEAANVPGAGVLGTAKRVLTGN